MTLPELFLVFAHRRSGQARWSEHKRNIALCNPQGLSMPCCVAARGGCLPKPDACILWALVVVVLVVVGGGGLASCGGSTDTCLGTDITYNGSKTGAAYELVVSDDGGRSLFRWSTGASIQFLMAIESSSVSCYGGGEPVDIPLTATVWIDPSGSAGANCSDRHSPRCQPLPNDPQGHRSAVLRFGQLTRIRLDVVDPP